MFSSNKPNPLHEGLTGDEFKGVLEAFQHAYELTRSRLSPEAVASIFDYLSRALPLLNTTTMFVERNLISLRDTVFQDEILRDFILDLTTAFYFFWHESGVKNTNISYHLSVACCNNFTGPDDPNLLVPRDIAIRQNDFDNTYKYLCANKWLVTYVMLYMTVRLSFSKK